MSVTEVFTGRRYEIVAFANNQTPVYYDELEAAYGSGEDGAWLLIATDASEVSVYSGDSAYGPYGYRDDFRDEFGIGPFLFSTGLAPQSDLDRGVISEELRQAFVSNNIRFSKYHRVSVTTEPESGNWRIRDSTYDGDYYVTKQDNALNTHLSDYRFDRSVPSPSISREQARQFVNRGDYKPLLVVPADTMVRLCEERTLVNVLPDDIREEDRDGVARTIITAMKLGMAWPLGSDRANKELRSDALMALSRQRARAELAKQGIDTERQPTESEWHWWLW